MAKGFDLGTDLDTNATVASSEDTAGMTFDLSSVEDVAGFEVLPKGTYDAIVDEFEFTTSQSSGAPMIKAVYLITNPEYENRKIFDYYVLTGAGAPFALPKLKKLLSVTCPEYPMNEFNPSKFCESGEIIGRSCGLVLSITTQKQGEYKGEKRNQVRDIVASQDTPSFM